MAGNPQVLGLLEEMLDSGKTPEEVCRDCPELLPEVRRAVAGVPPHRRGTSWSCSRAFGRLRMPARSRPCRRPPTCRRSPATRWRRCSAAAAWAWSTRPGNARSTASVALKMLLAGPFAGPQELGAFPPGGRGPRLPAAPEHRAGLRRRRRRGPAVLRHGVRRGGQPGPEAGGHAPAGPPGGRAGGHAGRGRAGGPPGAGSSTAT